MGAVGHVGGRVGEDQVRRLAAQAAGDECRVRGVAPEKAMGTQLPAGAGGDPAGLAVVGRQGFLEVEPLRPGPFLALVEAGQQILEIGLSEAAQRQVPRRRLLQVDQQAGQQVLVPRPADAVQGDVEQARVRRGQVEQDHGHRREAGTAGGDEPLVARDHAPVGAAGEHGVDAADDRAGQGRQLRLRLARETRHRYFREVRCFFAWCERTGFVADTPFRGLRNVQVPLRVVQPFRPAEIAQLLDACDPATPMGLRDRALLLTLLDSGIRCSETVGLDLGDCDFTTRRLHVRHGKGHKERVVLWCFKTLSALCESRPPESLRAERRRCGSIGDCFWSGWECSAGGDGI